ncbi:hypothetical protein HN385_03435 [archaeon]|jgi:hypothetical protein|nr:hypothetical protein [archaeon]MBT3450684.1 hypothetical protein [archaeon]MBT6869749.1 hypothetical protein [archaeon]MBT7192704.1 hypothetical protein [archaeon]MBT7380729.1 hypothetical protein [archaeon]
MKLTYNRDRSEFDGGGTIDAYLSRIERDIKRKFPISRLWGKHKPYLQEFQKVINFYTEDENFDSNHLDSVLGYFTFPVIKVNLEHFSKYCDFLIESNKLNSLSSKEFLGFSKLLNLNESWKHDDLYQVYDLSPYYFGDDCKDKFLSTLRRIYGNINYQVETINALSICKDEKNKLQVLELIEIFNVDYKVRVDLGKIIKDVVSRKEIKSLQPDTYASYYFNVMPSIENKDFEEYLTIKDVNKIMRSYDLVINQLNLNKLQYLHEQDEWKDQGKNIFNGSLNQVIDLSNEQYIQRRLLFEWFREVERLVINGTFDNYFFKHFFEVKG